MASKIHRDGVAGYVASWEPPLKYGAQPARSGAEAGGYRGFAAGEQDDQARDIERQAEERAQAAYRRGLQEGDANGRTLAAAQVDAAVERLARTAAEIANVKPRLRHDAEEDVVKLAMAISRRILYREIATDPEALRGLVRAALDKLDKREVYRVRVNPQDAPAVDKHIQGLNLPGKMEILGDPALERGSAVFETAHGSFDASAGTQLEEIERGFADLVRRSP